MNFFKIKTSWSNIELWVFKIGVFSAGIAAGVWFHKYLENYILLFVSLTFIISIWLAYLWINKMKESRK